MQIKIYSRDTLTLGEGTRISDDFGIERVNIGQVWLADWLAYF